MNNINAKSHDELFDIKMTNNIKKKTYQKL